MNNLIRDLGFFDEQLSKSLKDTEELSNDFELIMSLSNTSDIPKRLTPARILQVAEYALEMAPELGERVRNINTCIKTIGEMPSARRRFGCI